MTEWVRSSEDVFLGIDDNVIEKNTVFYRQYFFMGTCLPISFQAERLCGKNSRDMITSMRIGVRK